MPSRFVEHTSEESYEAQQAAAAESAAPAQAQPEQERAQPQPEQAQAKTVKTCPSRSKNWFKKRTPPTETQPQPRPQQQQQQQQGQAQRISAPQIQAQGSPALDKQREATHSQQQSTSVNAAAAPSSSGPLSGTPAAQSSSPDPDDDLMPLWRDPSPILSALYPLTHFIGHRPPSHPHYPEPYRLTPTSNHPDYRAHHRFFGYLFGLGAPEVERMTKEKEEREERLGKSKASRAWGKIVRGAWVKSIDMVHTLIASWTGIVLL